MRATTFALTLGASACLLLLASAATPAESTRQEAEDGHVLTTPQPAVPTDPPALERWRELDCASCHSVVAEEWSQTAHAVAWIDRDYRESLEGKRRPASCHGCHAPRPLLVEGELPRRVRARDVEAPDAHFGVTCVTCHQGPGDTILGPWGHETKAHASVRSEHHRPEPASSGASSSALCASCHATTIGPVVGVAKDFEEAGLEAEGLSCVGCHMAPVERRWAHASGADPATDESVPVRPGRSHMLQTPRDPAFLRLAFGFSLGKEGGARTLVIRNQAGHRVPGLEGRSMSFEVTSLDASGAALDTSTLTLDVSAHLRVRGSRTVSLAEGAIAARVVGMHQDPRAEATIEFLRLDVEQ